MNFRRIFDMMGVKIKKEGVMELKQTIKVLFSVFILFALVLNNQPSLAHGLDTEGAIVKAANTTLHIHDEVEAHKLLHNPPSDTRKRKIILLGSSFISTPQ
jgi:hypothetical protein